MTRAGVIAPDVEGIAARLPAGAARGTSREEIARAVAFVVERFGAEWVVLFGSRAEGRARPGSDVDLLVVQELPEGTPVATTRRANEIWAALRAAGFERVQPTVRTPEQIRVGLAEGDFFVEDMMAGVVLFAAEGDEGGAGRMAEGGGGHSERERGPLGLDRATEEWIAKAEADDRGAARVAAPPPELDLVCFLCQQSAEKWLKALLQEQGMRFGRTHALTELADAAAAVVPALAERRNDLEWLSGFAVAVRYPGRAAGAADAERALAIAGEVRRLVREGLGLAPD